jgi:hypothetical protein
MTLARREDRPRSVARRALYQLFQSGWMSLFVLVGLIALGLVGAVVSGV